jgi:hypothetical protein
MAEGARLRKQEIAIDALDQGVCGWGTLLFGPSVMALTQASA